MAGGGAGDASEDRVARFVGQLMAYGSMPLAESPLGDAEAAALGLRPEGDRLCLPQGWDPLDAEAIRGQLGSRAAGWLRVLEVRPAIGSTNVELVRRAQLEPVDGHVCLAEVQLAGRGRRGRSWISPLGGNLALSLGFAAKRPAAELGGLSLVVGLAVIDVLESHGVAGLSLKWPNDVLLHGAKLGGILIELVQTGDRVALVVGVGINVQLPEQARRQLDQAVADLASTARPLPGRSTLAARLISGIVDFEAEFAAAGFAPFVEVFDRRHAFQGREVLLLRGTSTLTGRVLGVASDGGLRVTSDSGEEVVRGGEVSLRPPPMPAA